MAEVDLLFEQPAGGADLLFGWTYAPTTTDAVLAATLPALIFTAKAIPQADIAILANLPALALMAECLYQSGAQRPLVQQDQEYWQEAENFLTGFESIHDVAIPTFSLDGASPWASGNPCLSATAPFWQSADRQPSAQIVYHQNAQHLSPGGVSASHQDGIDLHHERSTLYQEAIRAGWIRRAAYHQDGLRDRRKATASRYDNAAGHPGIRLSEAIQGAHSMLFRLAAFHQNAIRPPPGITLFTITPPQPTPCYTPNGNLLFVLTCPQYLHSDIIFFCELPGSPGCLTHAIPVKRVYFVANNVYLRRVSDNAEIPALSLALALDVDSWAWSFEASIPGSALALIDPGEPSNPVELVAGINGTAFRILAEEISRERTFGRSSIRVTGRGRNAALAAPYAPVMHFNNAALRTAQQLMNDVLTHDGTPTGVPLGWTVDWGLTDWHVPAGAFNHQGTWIEAVLAITASAGGYLIPHPSTMSLKVRHQYPVAPWQWDQITPDYSLPADVVVRESLRWVDKPIYNRVFVSGQDIGILGQVTRTGTAGDLLAPMVVDPLITQAEAARQRGIAILADTGRQIEETLRLPVLAETGIIEPGAFIEYQDGTVDRLGIVRSTRVEAGFPEVWQTLGVQSYV